MDRLVGRVAIIGSGTCGLAEAQARRFVTDNARCIAGRRDPVIGAE